MNRRSRQAPRRMWCACPSGLKAPRTSKPISTKPSEPRADPNRMNEHPRGPRPAGVSVSKGPKRLFLVEEGFHPVHDVVHAAHHGLVGIRLGHVEASFVHQDVVRML